MNISQLVPPGVFAVTAPIDTRAFDVQIPSYTFGITDSRRLDLGP